MNKRLYKQILWKRIFFILIVVIIPVIPRILEFLGYILPSFPWDLFAFYGSILSLLSTAGVMRALGYTFAKKYPTSCAVFYLGYLNDVTLKQYIPTYQDIISIQNPLTSDLVKRLQGSKVKTPVLVVGTPGSGKSTSLRTLVREAVFRCKKLYSWTITRIPSPYHPKVIFVEHLSRFINSEAMETRFSEPVLLVIDDIHMLTAAEMTGLIDSLWSFKNRNTKAMVLCAIRLESVGQLDQTSRALNLFDLQNRVYLTPVINSDAYKLFLQNLAEKTAEKLEIFIDSETIDELVYLAINDHGLAPLHIVSVLTHLKSLSIDTVRISDLSSIPNELQLLYNQNWQLLSSSQKNLLRTVNLLRTINHSFELATIKQIYERIFNETSFQTDITYLNGTIWFSIEGSTCNVPDSALECVPHETLTNDLMTLKEEVLQSYDVGRTILLEESEAYAILERIGVYLGNVLKDHQIVEDIYKFLTNKLPNESLFRNNLGLALVHQEEYERAISEFRIAVKLQSKYSDAWSHLGHALAQCNKINEAKESFKNAIKHDVGHIGASLGLAVIYRNKGDLNGAKEILERALRHYPESPKLLASLGGTLVQLDYTDDAETMLRKSLQYDSRNLSALINLGTIMLEQRNLDDAEEIFNKALEIDPEQAEAWIGLGNVLQIQKKLDASIDAFSCAIELDSDNKLAWSNLGGVLAELNRVTEAENAFNKALQIDPEYIHALKNKARMLGNTGRFKEAIELLKAVIEKTHNDGEAWSELGGFLLVSKYIKEAQQALEKAISIDETDFLAWNNLGVVYNLEGMDAKAEDAMMKVISLEPQFADGWLNLSSFLNQKGRNDEARAAFETAVKLDSSLVGMESEIFKD